LLQPEANRTIFERRRRRLSADDIVITAAQSQSYDMRTHPLFPIAVKNQGACGSCWAHTCAGTLTIQNLFLNNDLRDISVQSLISCDIKVYNSMGQNTETYWNAGCDGGYPEWAWDWAVEHGGLPLESLYPEVDYTSGNMPTPKCEQAWLSPAALVPKGNTIYLPTTSPASSAREIVAAEQAIIQQVNAGRPVTIQLAAGSPCFQTYSPDQTLPLLQQMMTCECGGPDDPVDHAILVIGYTPLYFIARNQWGSYWGINGYAYIPRNSANPELNLPGSGQCNMLSGPVYLASVEQISMPPTPAPVPSQSPTAVPSERPTKPAPTTLPPLASTSCPPALPTQCPLQCCRSACVGKLCLADASKLCCADGSCAKLVVKKGKLKAVC